jgi:putative MATE family efflux protein
MVSQNVLNLVDTAMVGTLGNAALAAVGLGSFANFMSTALILGVSVGVQAMASRRQGEGRLSETAIPLNGGIAVVMAVGLPLSLVLFLLAPEIYGLLNNDPEVVRLGTTYFQVRVSAAVFVGINFAFRGYWNAVDMSKLYMSTLVVMHIINICLNYVLIFGKLGFPELGVQGAAIGTAGSTAIGTLIYFGLGFKHARSAGFLKQLPKWENILALVKISIPNGIQQLFFAAGWLTLYTIIGRVGTAELAAANVLINCMLVAILPGIGLGLGAATLVGQALGRKDKEDAFQWGFDVVKVGLVGLGFLGALMMVFPDLILSIFLTDPVTLEMARLPMRLSGLMMPFEAFGLILMNALLGAGDSKRVMIVSIMTQWGFFLPAAWLIGPILGMGLLEIWICNGIYRIATSAVFVAFWRSRSWAEIKL